MPDINAGSKRLQLREGEQYKKRLFSILVIVAMIMLHIMDAVRKDILSILDFQESSML